MAAFLKWVADGSNLPSRFLKKNGQATKAAYIGVMSIGFCCYTYKCENDLLPLIRHCSPLLLISNIFPAFLFIHIRVLFILVWT